MKKLFLLCLFCLACFPVLTGCQTGSRATASPASPGGKKSTYVLVHGAWGGGWDWKHVDQLLTADGCEVYGKS